MIDRRATLDRLFAPAAARPRASGSRRNDHQLPRATRALTADETIARVLAHKDVLGITRVANLTGLDRTGIPVVMVCRPNARSSAVFNGKGIDIAAAKASALMEAAETWHAEHVRAPAATGHVRRDARGLPGRRCRRIAATPPGLVSIHTCRSSGSRGATSWTDGPVWAPFEIVHADFRVCPGRR